MHFIQLIYGADDTIKDCEFIRQKKIVHDFLETFRDDVERARMTSTLDDERTVRVARVGDDDKTHYEDVSAALYEDAEDETTGFRNVTFRVLEGGSPLPSEVAAWLDYESLKSQCKKSHQELKKLVRRQRHGTEEEKKDASDHIERSKRELTDVLIVPGTKWCGPHQLASRYVELGPLSSIDRCCRKHDHCRIAIPGFTNKYHFFNYRPFTLSHCGCDSSACALIEANEAVCSLLALQRMRTDLRWLALRFDWFSCVEHLEQSGADKRKRELMDIFRVPGTKWCGKGNMAMKYTHLGGFNKADKCCRVHDTACPFYISAFEERYGLFNWRISTIMHCNCDERPPKRYGWQHHAVRDNPPKRYGWQHHAVRDNPTNYGTVGNIMLYGTIPQNGTVGNTMLYGTIPQITHFSVAKQLNLAQGEQSNSQKAEYLMYSSPVASLVLTDSSQLTSDSQHLGIYSSPVASLVLTDSSQLTSDNQHLAVSGQSPPQEATGLLYTPFLRFSINIR
uniref:phospholipase A2 n=1 Tax=Timema douglasi TaxID=61478 RepID=A0A7R8VTU2_TIMDO|nr:unnamed protein product [Timema douglasi]